MLFNSYSYEILYEQFHWIYLQGDIKLLLVTVNNRLKLEIESRSRPIVSPYTCHPNSKRLNFKSLVNNNHDRHWLATYMMITHILSLSSHHNQSHHPSFFHSSNPHSKTHVPSTNTSHLRLLVPHPVDLLHRSLCFLSNFICSAVFCFRSFCVNFYQCCQK